MYSSTITEYEDNKGRKSEQPGTENGTHSILHQPPIEHIPAEQPLIWRNIIGIAILHFVGVYLFITQCVNAKLWTWIFFVIHGHMIGLGITAGVHRLWTHRSYKAKLSLRIFLMYLYCSAGHQHPTKWIRNHRTHHRYADTSADPHNAKRGFFFSHVGWLMMKQHPAVKEYGKYVDLSDLAEDPVIRFADKYYSAIMISMCFILPLLVPIYGWNETWTVGISAVIVRYLWVLNAASSVNSFAHIWGCRPYNRSIKPAENFVVSIFAAGEGWHNYHHCFPWDYKASEYGRLNPTTSIINLMAWLGLAYDLKTPSNEIVDKYCANKGDNTSCPMTKRLLQDEQPRDNKCS